MSVPVALVVSARILLSISCEDANTLLFCASTLTFISLLFKKKVSRNQMAGVLIVLLGLALSMGVNGKGFLNIGILYLLVADLCFAVSIVLLEEISAQMNPAVLVMGELFFGSLFSSAGAWIG